MDHNHTSPEALRLRHCQRIKAKHIAQRKGKDSPDGKVLAGRDKRVNLGKGLRPHHIILFYEAPEIFSDELFDIDGLLTTRTRSA